MDSFAAACDDASLAISLSDQPRNLVAQIENADRAGLSSFGIGEHHRREYLDSAPAVILGAAATRTECIRLTSAVTVLSAADPVRVFQEFATRSSQRSSSFCSRCARASTSTGPVGIELR